LGWHYDEHRGSVQTEQNDHGQHLLIEHPARLLA